MNSARENGLEFYVKWPGYAYNIRNWRVLGKKGKTSTFFSGSQQPL